MITFIRHFPLVVSVPAFRFRSVPVFLEFYLSAFLGTLSLLSGSIITRNGTVLLHYFTEQNFIYFRLIKDDYRYIHYLAMHTLSSYKLQATHTNIIMGKGDTNPWILTIIMERNCLFD